MDEEFDVIVWLNKYFKDRSLNRDDISSVLDFVLIWNLFEDIVCDKNYNKNSICILIDNNHTKFNEENFYYVFKYFQKRYIKKENQVLDKFKYLKIQDRQQEELILKVLKWEETSKSSIIKTIIYIIYRFRCNLFHWEKDILKLHYQNENYVIINKFLAFLIEILKPNI